MIVSAVYENWHLHSRTDNRPVIAGMFALQAACEKARVEMIHQDCCFIPGANPLSREQHIGHYSVDPLFDKRAFPNIREDDLDPAHPYYGLVREWLDHRCSRYHHQSTSPV